MRPDLYLLCGLLAGASPLLAIAVILFHYWLRRAVWKIRRRRGGRPQGFCPGTSALGMALLFTQMFLRPTLKHVLEERQEEAADGDDQGDPEGREDYLNRQLRRIRRGEAVGDLILRL